ncbi:MAG: DEAD/DEAH box helicase, partial [Candidatus Woesearchaeota archaeon]
YNMLSEFIYEVNKQRKRLTIRQLVEKFIDRGLLDLFPVWMCSPESTSTIFPLQKDIFDVIIFDEASQCKIEKAIPSIIRGKKVIVAGDEKQLPPTNFFMASFDDEDQDDEELSEEEELLNEESLLVRAKKIFPGKRLIYHYRSKHPELINFSNHAFYNGYLRIIPRNKIKVNSPITYIQTKGLWRDRCNIEEAEQVVILLKKLLKNNEKGYTFGIITFNVNQMDAIEEAIEKAAQDDPLFGELIDLEKNRYEDDQFIGLFVKNIETVQGDERDIIIFSVGYDYDETRKFRYSFGPLNGIYGPNRLNVAISRAKEKIYVFSSFEPTNLKYEGRYNGPKLLRKYLEYCKYVSEQNYELSYTILKSLNETEI